MSNNLRSANFIIFLIFLNKLKNIVEIKTFPNPPKAVVLVMEAVMIYVQEKTDWNNVRAVLGDT